MTVQLFSQARSFSRTCKLTQLLGNSSVLLFVHQAESNVLVIKISQNLSCELDGAKQAEGGVGRVRVRVRVRAWGRERKVCI